MKLDLNQLLPNFKGEPLQQDGQPITLRWAIQHALIEIQEADRSLTAMQKFELEGLARRAQADEADFSVEELATIKSRINGAFGQLVVGPAFRAIDPVSDPA